MVKYFGKKKITRNVWITREKRDLWTSHLVINKMNQKGLLNIFSYQFSIFYISIKNVTILHKTWGYDKHSLNVLMSSQAESPKAEGYWAMNNKNITIPFRKEGLIQ